MWTMVTKTIFLFFPLLLVTYMYSGKKGFVFLLMSLYNNVIIITTSVWWTNARWTYFGKYSSSTRWDSILYTDIFLCFLLPAPEEYGRYCFHRCVSVNRGRVYPIPLVPGHWSQFLSGGGGTPILVLAGRGVLKASGLESDLWWSSFMCVIPYFHKNVFGDLSHFCAATDTPVLKFWGRMLWVSKPEWIPHLHAFSPQWSSEKSPVWRLLTSWWPECQLSLLDPHIYLHIMHPQFFLEPMTRHATAQCSLPFDQPAYFLISSLHVFRQFDVEGNEEESPGCETCRMFQTRSRGLHQISQDRIFHACHVVLEVHTSFLLSFFRKYAFAFRHGMHWRI